jgi:hypothetical protein
MGEGSPLTSGAVQGQDGVDHFVHIGGAGSPSWQGFRDQRLQDRPFLLIQIAWIASSLHLPTSSLFPFGTLFPFLLLLYSITWLASLQSRSPGPFIGLILLHLASQAFTYSLLVPQS